MKTATLEVLNFQVLEKTFPGWMRGRDLLALVGDYVPGWQGPEPQGWHILHAFTVHQGSEMDSSGLTVWLLGRSPDQHHQFTPERWQQGAEYIMARVGRRAHQPKNSFTSTIVRGFASPGNN